MSANLPPIEEFFAEENLKWQLELLAREDEAEGDNMAVYADDYADWKVQL